MNLLLEQYNKKKLNNMEIIDRLYFGKYAYYANMYDDSFSMFLAAVMLYIQIILVFIPSTFIVFFYSYDFVFKADNTIVEYIMYACIVIIFAYCWHYFAFRKNAKRIKEKYMEIDEIEKKKMRRIAGRFTLFCYILFFIQSIILIPLYVNWSFEQGGKKPWYKEVIYIDKISLEMNCFPYSSKI
jgi:hypothetical protein